MVLDRAMIVGSLFMTSAFAFAQVEASPPAVPDAKSQPSSSLGARFDCLHDFNRDKGSSQDCLTITGLRIGIRHQASPTVVGTLQVDPFATPMGGRENSPRRSRLPGRESTELGIIDNYAVTWSPRPNLELAAESYDGAAKIRSISGLAMSNSLSLNGWKQSAMTVTYNLSALPDMRVKFAVGNGEGEDTKNLDPQQYFGFEAGATVVRGVKFYLGVSLDGNSAGSNEAKFLSDRYQSECNIVAPTDSKLGHSTQRLAAGLALDGSLPGVEGLKAAVGWQRNVLSDIDKKRSSVPSVTQLKGATCGIEPDGFFVEASDDAAVNTVQQTTYDVSLLYKFLTSYFVAADYTTRRIDTGSVEAFFLCDSYSNGSCTTFSSEALNKMSQDAFTFGAGMILAPDLTLTVEYHESKYDNKYAQIYYAAPDGKTSDALELFNARLSYNWQ